MNYTNEQINELSEGLIVTFFNRYEKQPKAIDIELFITACLKKTVIYEAFAEEDHDKMGFTSNGEQPLTIVKNNTKMQVVFPSETIVIDSYLLNPKEEKRRRFTLAHEAAHCIFDKACGSSVGAHFYSDFDTERVYSLSELKARMGICEWQTNAMAAALLMPRFIVKQTISQYTKSEKLPVFGKTIFDKKTEDIIVNMAKDLNVSVSALKYRLKTLDLLEYNDISEYISKCLNIGGFFE